MRDKEYIMWQYCHDPNDINNAIKEYDEDWEGLESASQIINITWDSGHGCHVVFWKKLAIAGPYPSYDIDDELYDLFA